jgi:hypothetical protein
MEGISMKWLTYCETCKKLLNRTNSFIRADSTSDKFAVISIIKKAVPESLGMLAFYSFSHLCGPMYFDDGDNAVRIQEESLLAITGFAS